MVAVFVLALLLGYPHGPHHEGTIERRATVHFSVDQDAGLSTEQLGEAIDQVRQIWGPLGVAVSWGRYGEPTPSGEAAVSLRIIRSPGGTAGAATALAWVSLGPSGLPTDPIFVSVYSVTALLSQADVSGRPLSQRPTALRERLIGRAIGRVVAHELAHCLLQSATHSATGLRRAHFTPAELLGTDLGPFQIEATERAALMLELVRLAQLQEAGR